MTARIATLTLNPSIDASAETDEVRPTHKTRTFGERMDPGGGGINVARVLQRFGAQVQAIYLAGGITGRVLDDLLSRAGVDRTWIPVEGETRMSLTVHERSTGLEYRFVPDGPELEQHEWRAALDEVELLECDYLVASGSLPEGVPEDFYARVCAMLAGRPTRFILDTSGPALRAALSCGEIFLMKPSKSELEQYAGHELAGRDDLTRVASEIVASGQAENVAVTLGSEGALLVNRGGATWKPAIEVETRSAVGAGDSFVAAMTYGFATGMDAEAALRLGMAAGAATALTPGTDLCHPADIRRLLGEVEAA